MMQVFTKRQLGCIKNYLLNRTKPKMKNSKSLILIHCNDLRKCPDEPGN